jgi:hypothetical protein
MSYDLSPRLALPLLNVGQAQKEVTHNEALALLDLLTQPVVVAVGTNAPPEAPLPGQCWIVGDAPEQAWRGHAQAFAGWIGGGWRFVIPTPGMRAWSAADGVEARYGEHGWTLGVAATLRLEIGGVQVVGAQQPAIAAPASGGVIDAEARGVITAILAALHTHGLIAVSPPPSAG